MSHSKKTVLYEVAVIHNLDDERVLIIPPTSILASSDNNAKLKASLMANKVEDFDVEELSILIRPFI